LLYDRSTRAYVCLACGLTYTSQDLLMESQRRPEDKMQEERRRKYAEYLEWWSASKK